MKTMNIELDMSVAEKISKQYIMELYREVQKDIFRFINQGTTMSRLPHNWREYESLHEDSVAIKRLLRAMMSDADYKTFLGNVYDDVFLSTSTKKVP